MTNRILALLIVAIMTVTMIPALSYAEAEIVESGSCSDNITWELTDDGILKIKGSGEMPSFYSGCPWTKEKIKSVIVEGDITNIGAYAFHECVNLTEVRFPDGITAIDNYAFAFCKSLKSVNIPETITYIGDYAFVSCSLSSVECLIIPDGVEEINTGAFKYCYMQEVVLPEGITCIDEDAFYSCWSLEKINIPEGVTKIGSNAFGRCKKLKEITIPSSVKYFGYGIFNECTISTMEFSEGRESIDGDIFRISGKVETVIVPGSVKIIDENTFKGYRFNEIVLREGVEQIKVEAVFCGRIVIPKTVVSISDLKGNVAVAAVELDSYAHEYVKANKINWECQQHQNVTVYDAVDPTCSKTGLTEGAQCLDCGVVLIKQEIINATGHNYGDWIVDKEATCTEKGSKYKSCSKCKAKILEDIEAWGFHTTIVDKAIKPTCTETGLTEGSHCAICYKVLKAQDPVPAKGHVPGAAATCTAAQICTVCKTELAPVKAHSWKDATCTASKTCETCGTTEGTALDHNWTDATCMTAKTCTACGITEGTTLPHKYGEYKTIKRKATFGMTGKQTRACINCFVVDPKDKAIAAVAVPTLSKTAYIFNNKAQKPAVKIAGISSSNYSVKYASGCKNVGTYKVTVTLKGANYYGSKVVTFKINPAKPASVKLTKGKKQIKVSWKKPAKAYRNQIDGYQIRYATSKSKLAKATPKKYSGKTLTNKTVKKLKAKKKYYVQVRTYNKIGKTTYYSGWTTAKTVKTK